jgi:hydrogenase maturation protease
LSEGTLVLALGNPLRGDDGAGAAILGALSHAASLPQDVTLLDGGACGLETTLLLQGYRRAIILDAGEIGGAPGEWICFTPGDAVMQPVDMSLSGTLHNARLAEALALGEALGILPPEVTIYAVQPQAVGWSPGLSEPVQKAIPAICTAILKELGEVSKHEDTSRCLRF